MKTRTIETYQFEELSDAAKEKAREWFREGICEDSFWHESIYEDAAQIFEILGIFSQRAVQTVGGKTRYEPNIEFSGFWSQGDGASFEGTYYYAKGAAKKIREYAPIDEKLHSIADRLQELQRRHFYKLTAVSRRIGHHYSHSNTVAWETECDWPDSTRPSKPGADGECTEIMRDLSNWIYRTLEAQYEYLNSDESVDENIKCNEYEFTAEGRRAVTL